jgi:hypothetical protein
MEVEMGMARANLTLQMDSEVIRRARIVAAKRGTSVSALAASRLQEMVDEDDRLELARARAEAILAKASGRGGRSWTRDDLHEREALHNR